MPVYGIIPARGGSKGIPGKNLRTVAGVPLIGRAVRAASESACIDRVFVTTDDDAIAEVAARAGAEIIERPAELATDTATSESALMHALDVIAERGYPDPSVVVMMQCTSPLTTAEEIDGTIALVRNGADCAFTGARSHVFLWRLGPDGAVALNHDASHRPRRQDQDAQFTDTGAVYAMRAEGLHTAKHRFFGRIAIYEVPLEHALEIDTVTELSFAQVLLDARAAAARAAHLPDPVCAIALDFDGVLTDDRVLTAQDGGEAVFCSRSDGMGIEMLRAAGIPAVVLSKEVNPVVSARCRKLQVECVQGVEDKASALVRWIKEHDLPAANVVFVGNDVNDVECLRIAGCGVAVADASDEARAAANIVLTREGGDGAVRELIDLVLSRMRRA